MDIDHKPGCSAIAILIIFVGILFTFLNIELGFFIFAGLAFLIISFGDDDENKDEDKKDPDHEKLSDYRYAILVLLARVMSADGRQMKCELDVVKSAIRRYYITEDEQKKALKQLQSILNNIDKYKKYNLNEICRSINKKFGYNYTSKSELIKILLSVAYADGDLQKGGAFNEENEIQIIANHHLGILSYDYQNILSFFKNKYEQKKYNTEFRYSILQLLARVMKADGKQMKCELDRVKSTIRRYYKTEDERLAALKQFQSILNDNKRFHINKICSIINQKFDYAVKSELIMELLAVAYADDKFSSKEKSTIDKIVINLQISPDEYESIKNIFRKKYNQGEYKYDENRNEYNESNENKKKDENKNKSKSNSNRSKSGSISVSEAYDILKVEGNASDEEVKKAYRVLAMMYHPDKFYSLGDEAVRQATESMKQINAAWDVVKEARGMR